MLSHLQARVALIFNTLGQFVASVTPMSINFNSFKLKITLSDGSNLRLNEQYRSNNLETALNVILENLSQTRPDG